MQCAATAAVAVGSAAGIRGWAAAHRERLGEPFLRVLTAVLLVGAVIAAGLIGA